MPSCRLLPHGAYSLLPAILATLAWLCSISQDGCNFARLEGPIVRDITNSEIIPYVEVGFVAYRKPQYNPVDDSWNVVYGGGTCLMFDDTLSSSIQDSYWIAAKLLAFVALVLGGAGALFVCFSTCFVLSKATWRLAGYQILLACICQCLSFIWFATNICHHDDDDVNVNSCHLFMGSKADICASIFFLGSGLLILHRYPKSAPKVNNLPTNNNNNIFQMEETTTNTTTEGNDDDIPPLEGHAHLPITVMEESLTTTTTTKNNNDLYGFKDADAEIL
jgi:hypothetical protein